MFKGSGIRTPRTRAEELGTEADGFKGKDYHVPGGHPVTKELPASVYKDLEPQVGGSAKPIDPPKPFKIG